jgi:hypothetical protein
MTNFFGSWPTDATILAWASSRAIILYVLFRLASWVAKQTPWSGDDELVQIGEDTFKRFKK